MPEAEPSASITRQEVHQALESLYDGLALGQTALAARLPLVAGLPSAPERARKLRTLLRDAIELLQPARPASFRSPATRSYDVMTLRFVEGLSMAQVAEELAISERQAYRDLWRAEDCLAGLLATSPTAEGDIAPAEAPCEDALGAELRALPARTGAVELALLLEEARQTVAPLAQKLGGEVAWALPAYPLSLSGDPGLLRLTLVKMLTAALRAACDAQVCLQAQAVAEEIALSLHFHGADGAPPGAAFAEVESLARAQRLLWDLALGPGGEVVASLVLPRRGRRLVLLLEDNASIVELYRRFLAESDEWELRPLPDAETLLAQARSQRPAVLVLDVLLPQVDGWQVLQRLRAQPETMDLPVLICSVFDDQELATTLGADGYLKKPVSRERFLAGLRECLYKRNRPARRPASS